MKRMLLIGLMLGLPVLAPAQDAPQGARDQLRVFGDGLDALTARFEQAVTGPDGELVDHGSGTVSVRRPDLFRWSYEGEFPELIIADGENVWLYDEALEQVTVRPQSALAADSPLMLLTNPDDIDAQFTVTELGTIDGAMLLELSTRGGDAEFDRVLIGFAENRPVSMVMEDAFGMRTEIRFGEVQRNPELEPGQFAFTPPDGVDVVGELADDAEAFGLDDASQ
ncbi:outer membrane lipoprotein chaperone LolA [Marinihelvus fidelis]|uniref:Outer-membrane lipoprotein carrier protein n=1 Tax=Marinihelvus fidelis TaxID=2613842 RepID=A0A5N0TB80_9GAMM|nr:outer membrane lipoprotein chaperone LolA [Marinihelvus fidelis]KAA9131928.1 outer membrane lipoprotein chaperone LolA [Marinihelvus fidelis]